MIESDPKESNDVQLTLDRIVNETLDNGGLLASFSREILGQSEEYILWRSSEFEIFLYKDGEAQIKSCDRSYDFRFELLDFESIQELQNQFSIRLKQAVSRKNDG